MFSADFLLEEDILEDEQGRKFMSCSHCQELGQQAIWLLPDWLSVLQPIRSQVSKFTRILTWLQLKNSRPQDPRMVKDPSFFIHVVEKPL